MLFFIEKLNYFFRILLIGAVFLTVATVLWLHMRKWMKKSGRIRFLYGFLLFSGISAIIIFGVGVVCLCLPQDMFQDYWTLFFWGWYMMSGVGVSVFHVAISGIWICGSARKGYELVKKNDRHLYQWNQPVADPEILDRFYQVEKEIGTKKETLLFYNAAVCMPFLKGIRCPVVIIPFMEFSPEEQILIFAHELTHLKYGDIIVRYLIKIIFSVYWFLPFEKIWMEEIEELQESRCDIEVCEKYGDHFSAGDYYKMIVALLDRQGKVLGKDHLISHLSGSSVQLEQRIYNMQGYRHGTSGKGMQMMTAMISSVVLFLTTVVCAVMPDVFVLQDERVEKYGIYDNIPCVALDHMDCISPEENGYLLQKDVLARYTLEPGIQIVSESFQAVEGDQLLLLLMSSAETYEVGLISRSKKMMIPHGRERISVNLELTEMEYKLYIRNSGEETLEIEVYCTQSKKE